jgi:hypothetical protein
MARVKQRKRDDDMFRSSLKVLLVAMLAAFLHACASISSSPDMDSLAFKRTALARSAEELKPDEAQEYARWALPFARIASHVYCKNLSATDPEKEKNWTARSFRNSKSPTGSCFTTGDPY